MSKRAIINALRRAANEGRELRLHHGSRSRWVQRGDPPAMEHGIFGVHGGTTKAQAKDAIDVPKVRVAGMDVHAPTLGHGYVDRVRFRRGREIETPDLNDWMPRSWRAAIDAGAIKGLDARELEALKAGIESARDGREVMKVLVDMGVKRVKYLNNYEGKGRYSYAALTPETVVPESLGYNAMRVGALGAGASPLLPGEAGDAEPGAAFRRTFP